MKSILGIIAFTLIIAGCQSSDCGNGIQDGNETGVDCGGDCASNCNTTGGGTNNYFNDIQGLWYFNYSFVENSFVSGGGVANNLTIYTGSTCKVDFTNTPATSSGYYNILGSAGVGCNYPSSGIYRITGNVISLFGTIIESLNGSNLQLASSGRKDYYNRTPITYANTENINWTVELASNYTGVGNFEIKLTSNFTTQVIIPIVAGQLSYSGTLAVNTNQASANVKIDIGPNTVINGTANAADVLEISSTALTWNGLTATSSNHQLCPFITGCNGVASINGSFSQITWN